MKIDVSDLLKDLGSVLNIDTSEKLDLKEDGIALTSPVKLNLKLINTGSTVLITGSLKTSVKMNCNRCLKEYDQPISSYFDEQYAKKSAIHQAEKEDGDEEEVELKDRDFVFEIAEDNTIDLGEAIRQNIIVSIPIKALCNKACKGLEFSGAAKKKTIDPRMEKLKQFKSIGGK